MNGFEVSAIKLTFSSEMFFDFLVLKILQCLTFAEYIEQWCSERDRTFVEGDMRAAMRKLFTGKRGPGQSASAEGKSTKNSAEKKRKHVSTNGSAADDDTDSGGGVKKSGKKQSKSKSRAPPTSSSDSDGENE